MSTRVDTYESSFHSSKVHKCRIMRQEARKSLRLNVLYGEVRHGQVVRFLKLSLGIITLSLFATGGFAEMTPIKGNPVIDAPDLLEWPYDGGTLEPNLNDPTSNTLHDFHARISSCDLVLSTEGNYHPALRDIWPIFLAKFKDRPLRTGSYDEPTHCRGAARSPGCPIG